VTTPLDAFTKTQYAIDVDTWIARSAGLIEEALFQVREADVIPLLDAAAQCQRIAMGEADPSSMDDYPFPGDGDGAAGPCSCPAGFVARGGFTSTCPVHGSRP
jgi:hypothetical protein